MLQINNFWESFSERKWCSLRKQNHFLQTCKISFSFTLTPIPEKQQALSSWIWLWHVFLYYRQMRYLVIRFYVKSSRHVVATQGPVKRCSSNSVKYSTGARRRKCKYTIAVISLFSLPFLPSLPPNAVSSHQHTGDERRNRLACSALTCFQRFRKK